MKQTFLLLIAIYLIANSCKSEPDPYVINKHNIGYLSDSTSVRELSFIFSNDSISKFIGGDEFIGNPNIIKIFEKETQTLLLELTPKEALDSLSTIQSIRIMDPRYKTNKGLNKLGTYKNISSKYNISGIQNTLRNLIVSVNEINAYFTIDKSELPENLRYDMTQKIEAVSIPPQAKIKDFFIQWY
tara:strand:- start:1154 stop:1711 length:558 start_codon:yes stop_codon:yes gene_type:complete